MNWAERRKLSYIAIFLVVFASIAFSVFRHVTHVAPSCYDKKQNQGETGVDCGGPCSFYCPNQLADPKVHWVRTFAVTPGIVQAVAYVEHSYPAVGAQQVGYTFKFYDAQNNPIAQRSGTTFLGPIGETAIAETLIPTGTSTVARASFSFNDPLPWQKISADFSQIVINTDRNLVETFNGGTRVTASLVNESRFNFTNLDVVAILYDKDGNAITASKILLPALPALQTKIVYFTWPYLLPSPVVRTQIIPRFNPFMAQSL